MNLDVEYLRGWNGSEESHNEQVTSSLVERFNATFDLTGDISDGAVAPLLLHLCLNATVAPTSALGPDGHPTRGGFLPPVPLLRRMWAGGAFTFHDNIRIGETVTRHSKIKDVVVKQGRTGQLCFVTVDHEIESDGRRVITERHDIVYRGADNANTDSRPSAATPEGIYCKLFVPSPTLLFRYSALTFNGHRIHYDAPYVREVEAYPGLIVHGPLQATMLVHFAASIRGKPPFKFNFRSHYPLFDDADFALNAIDDGDTMKLWTSRVNGPTAMEAKAQ